MSVLDKKLLSSDIQSVLDNYIPANSVRKIMEEIGEKLTRYDVTTKPDDGGGGQDENDQIIQLYVDAKSVDGLSDKTIARYKYTLDRLCESVGVPISKITVFHLRQCKLDTTMTYVKVNQRNTENNYRRYACM